MKGESPCPACGVADWVMFYELPSVPVHSARFLPTRREASGIPAGELDLVFCCHCGLIVNRAFDPELVAYGPGYEGTQFASPTFSRFARHLATRLVERYDLHGKRIVEIGCGQGEFLRLLCELGDNRGVGFDPAYTGEEQDDGRTVFVRDVYSATHPLGQGDLVCCRMTLEHIQPVADFVATVRHSMAGRPDGIVFFQVPDVVRILRERAFWDIYYEHCSYFSAGALARLFRRCGFKVIDLWGEYADQVLMIVAQAAEGAAGPPMPLEERLEDLAQEVFSFARACGGTVKAWRRTLEEAARVGRRVILWGGGSKAVAFLTTLGVGEEVSCVVDVNPRKHGTYVAGTGHEIVPPPALRDLRPDLVVVMNPVYLAEIREALACLGLAPELVTV